MKQLDVGIRIRADARFARLVDKAAELTGKSRSEFVRDAALVEAARVIQQNYVRGLTAGSDLSPSSLDSSPPLPVLP
jgi:uncharacterized protein (DUF1778 family)